jgi:hypothetical protein
MYHIVMDMSIARIYVGTHIANAELGLLEELPEGVGAGAQRLHP